MQHGVILNSVHEDLIDAAEQGPDTMEGDVDSGCEVDSPLRRIRDKNRDVTDGDRERKCTILHTTDDHVRISEQLNHKDREGKSKEFSLWPDKGREIRLCFKSFYYLSSKLSFVSLYMSCLILQDNNWIVVYLFNKNNKFPN